MGDNSSSRENSNEKYHDSVQNQKYVTKLVRAESAILIFTKMFLYPDK